MDALFHLEGDTAVPHPRTRSPWDPGQQHAGPAAALLTRAVERAASGTPLVTRLTLDILRPVPYRPLRVAASVVRPGSRVQLIEARLVDDDPVVVARAWTVRRRDPIPLGELPDPPIEPLTQPDELSRYEASFPHVDYEDFYGAAVEKRTVSGTLGGPGCAAVWMRLRQPVVAGEQTSPAQRVAAILDSANGVSWLRPVTELLFSNIDLSIHLWREPVDEWVGMDARSHLDPHGRGVSDTLIHDRMGPIGRGNQALFVEARD